MAELPNNKPTQEIQYTEEELQTISELTSFFSKSPTDGDNVGDLDSDNVGNLDSDNIDDLDRDNIDDLDSDNIDDLGGDSLGDLDGDSLGDLGGDSLGDLGGDSLGDLGGDSLGDLGGDSLGDLGGDSLGDLGGDSLGDLGGDSLGDLGGDSLGDLGGDSLGDLGGDSLGDLGGDSLGDLGGDSLGDLGGDSLGDLGGDSLGDLGGDSLGDLGGDSLGDLGGDSLGDLDGDSLGDLGGDSLGDLGGDSLGDLGGDSLGDLGGDSLGDLGGDSLGDLDGDSLGDLGGDSLGDLGGDSLGDLDGDSLGDLGGDSLGDLGGDSLGDLGGDSLGDLGGDSLGDLGLPNLMASAPEEEPEEIPEIIIPAPSFDEIKPKVQNTTQPEIDTSLFQASPKPFSYADDISNSDSETLQTLRKKLKSYPSVIGKLVVNTIIEDKLSPEDTSKLIELILQEAPLIQIQKELEAKLGIDLGDISSSNEKQVRLVISDPNYSAENLERQARRLRQIKFGSLVASLLIVFGTSLYFWGIKPILYKKIVAHGKEELLSNFPAMPDKTSIKEAESLFKKALFFYPEDTYAYIQYADAYKRLGLYDDAFKKIFGDVYLKQATTYQDKTLNTSNELWQMLKAVPIVRYADEFKTHLLINNTPWILKEKGAYLLSHLDTKKDNAMTLIALGQFHSNPTQKFKTSLYRNNLLGIDYFKRILTFNVSTPFLKKNYLMAQSLLNIGNVYQNQKDYYKAIEYYEKVTNQAPDLAEGHAAVLRALLKIYKTDKDPRMIVDYHNKVKYKYNVENKLPLYIQAQLASFYIDLPKDDDIQVNYNLSPIDHINGKALKERAYDLLNMLFHSKEVDFYGDTHRGNSYTPGYYEFSRYYRNVAKQERMALKQLEYVYKYNPTHFVALNDRAEILMSLQDYSSAIEYLNIAIEQLHPEKMSLLGMYPEDEILLEADTGKIYFNLGKAHYLSTVKDLGDDLTWRRMKEADKYKSDYDTGLNALSNSLDRMDMYFDQASKIGIHSSEVESELNYYQGWSYYARGNYRKALLHWESINVDDRYKNKNLEFATSHALYRLGTDDSDSETIMQKKKFLQSALGHLLFLQEYYEKDIKGTVLNNSREHMRLYNRLAMIENNLGSIYELFGDEEKASSHYWKSINYAKSISQENEVAHYNLNLNLKRDKLEKEDKTPVIMDYISPYFME